MRSMLVALLLAGVAMDAAASDFKWLEGSWERESRRGTAVEEWTRVSPNTLEGVAYITDGIQKRITEYLRIEWFGDQVFYTAVTSQNAFPTPFKLVESTDNRWVFENTTHDFPQRIIYTRHDDSRMTARIEGRMDGEEKGIDFEFTRAARASG